MPTFVAKKPSPTGQAALKVLYDVECGFCRWSVAQLLRLDRSASLNPVAIQSPEGQALLAALPPEKRLESAHIVTATGEVFSGGDAAPLIAQKLAGGAVIAPLAGLSPQLTRAGYSFVSANRVRIGRLVPTGSRAKADALLEGLSDRSVSDLSAGRQ